MAGLHLHTSDGADAETDGGEAAIPQHRTRCAGWDIRGEVRSRATEFNNTKIFQLKFNLNRKQFISAGPFKLNSDFKMQLSYINKNKSINRKRS